MMTSDYNDVTPVSNIVSVSPFHSVTFQDVFLSPNPNDRDAYPQGSAKINGQWTSLYALTATALLKLMNAAGIKEPGNRRMDDRSHPHICAWQYSAEWTQPDATVLAYSSDYELDLRDYISINGTNYKGARFQKAFND